jgi:hypothetical protein
VSYLQIKIKEFSLDGVSYNQMSTHTFDTQHLEIRCKPYITLAIEQSALTDWRQIIQTYFGVVAIFIWLQASGFTQSCVCSPKACEE